MLSGAGECWQQQPTGKFIDRGPIYKKNLLIVTCSYLCSKFLRKSGPKSVGSVWGSAAACNGAVIRQINCVNSHNDFITMTLHNIVMIITAVVLLPCGM